MLNEKELQIFDKYLKGIIYEENGNKKVFKKNLDKLKIFHSDKNLILNIMKKLKIRIVDKKVIKLKKESSVKNNNYGMVEANGLQEFDKAVIAKIDYSAAGEKIYEDYTALDDYLENKFIPNYVLMKRRKNAKGEREYVLSIALNHIVDLMLSEAEFQYVMNYLKDKNIYVGGKDISVEGEFENYDYINTHKSFSLPKVSSTETLKKIQLYQDTYDSILREEIIKDNMHLVNFVANKYAAYTGIDLYELESYGYEGLMVALEKFDLSYNCTFSTYAIAYIRGYIMKGIPEILNCKNSEFYRNYLNAKKAVEYGFGEKISENLELVDNVVDLLVNMRKIRSSEESIAYAKRRILSLVMGNASIDDEEFMEEMLASDQLLDPHDYAAEALNLVNRKVFNELLGILEPKEEKVIRLRFGFDDGVSRNLSEIARMLGISRSYSWILYNNAMKKIKQPWRISRLEDCDDIETEKYVR